MSVVIRMLHHCQNTTCYKYEIKKTATLGAAHVQCILTTNIETQKRLRQQIASHVP
jgi:hypothetical protein